jgi:hypothetical protein
MDGSFSGEQEPIFFFSRTGLLAAGDQEFRIEEVEGAAMREGTGA